MNTLKNRKALYAGSFDPFTKGHFDIVNRALNLFDSITILVAVSPLKSSLLTMEERKKIIAEIFSNNPKILVESYDGLIVDFAKHNDIKFILRGLRPTGDFELEFQMASMNKHLNPEIETYFLTTGENYFYVSSSLVKEVYKHGGDISDLVHENVLKFLNEKEK